MYYNACLPSHDRIEIGLLSFEKKEKDKSKHCNSLKPEKNLHLSTSIHTPHTSSTMAKERKEKKEKKSDKAEKVVVASGADSDMEVDAPARILDVSPIAAPMAQDKLTKKLLKTVKKGKDRPLYFDQLLPKRRFVKRF